MLPRTFGRFDHNSYQIECKMACFKPRRGSESTLGTLQVHAIKEPERKASHQSFGLVGTARAEWIPNIFVTRDLSVCRANRRITSTTRHLQVSCDIFPGGSFRSPKLLTQHVHLRFTRYPHVANVQHPSGPEAITPATLGPTATPTLSIQNM